MTDNEIKKLLASSISETLSEEFNSKVLNGIEVKKKTKRIIFIEDDFVLLVVTVLGFFFLAFVYVFAFSNYGKIKGTFIQKQVMYELLLIIATFPLFVMAYNKITRKKVQSIYL